MRSASPEVADGPRAAISNGSNASRMAIGLPTNLWRAEMRRREFIAGLGGAAVWPVAARGQQPAVPVIGYLGTGSPEAGEFIAALFRQGLKETGFIEGQNVEIVYRWD